MRPVNPEALGKPRGWSNGMLGPTGGRVLFVAGQTATGQDGRIAATGFIDQFELALERVIQVVREAGGEPTDVGRMTVYVTDLPAYRGNRKALGEAWRRQMGRHYPAMALVGVQGLVDEDALVEIEATAVLDP